MSKIVIFSLNNLSLIYSLDNIGTSGMGPQNFESTSLNQESEYASFFSEHHNIFDINIADNLNEHGKNCLSEPSFKNQIDNICIPCPQKKKYFSW